MIKIINAVDDKNITFNVEFKDITLEELFCELEISKMHIGAVLVNSVPKKLTEKLSDNSEIYILPILGGGC